MEGLGAVQVHDMLVCAAEVERAADWRQYGRQTVIP